jgi:hypothetical protein
LDPTERTAVVAEYRAKGSSTLWGFNFKPEFTSEYKEIFGLKCQRVTLFDEVSSATKGELWIARDFGIVLQDTEPVADGEIVWRAISVKLGPPEGAVFKIPEGYRTIVQ